MLKLKVLQALNMIADLQDKYNLREYVLEENKVVHKCYAADISIPIQTLLRRLTHLCDPII